MPFTLEDPTAAHPTSERLSECIHPSHGRIFNSHYRFHPGKGKVTNGLTARDNATTVSDKSFKKILPGPLAFASLLSVQVCVRACDTIVGSVSPLPIRRLMASET